MHTVSAPLKPWGSISQNGFLTPDDKMKNALKINFSMVSEAVGL